MAFSSPSTTYKYYLYSGTGNRFVLGTEPLPASKIRLLCTQFRVDGFLLLESSPVADAKLTIFNSDGSRPSMCGNGLRCVIAHLAQELEKPVISVATDCGVYSGTFCSWKRVVVDMTLPDWKFSSYTIQHGISGLPEKMFFIDSGVPHLVLFVPEVSSIDVATHGRFFRYHPIFAPEGVNVDFVEILGSQQLRLRTYERGLERESAACGTGAVAAAYVAFRNKVLEEGEALIQVSCGKIKIFIDGFRVSLEGSVVLEDSFSEKDKLLL